MTKGLDRAAKGLTLNKARLADIVIPLPPLPEQRRIAAILDQADALRAKRRAALAHLDEMAQAIFVEMFGTQLNDESRWAYAKLGEVASFISGGLLPNGTKFQGQANGFLLLKVSDLNSPRNERNVIESALWSLTSGSNASMCPKSATVFPKRGGAILTNKKRILVRSAVLDPNLMGVLPIEHFIDPEYLFGWFNMFDLKNITSGSSVPQLNKQDLAPLSIALPPLALQLQYKARIQALLNVQATMKENARGTTSLFASLQHQVFRGDL